MGYCTLNDLVSVLPENIVIGTLLSDENVNVLDTDAQFYIDTTASEMDGEISSFYRVPLMQRKSTDFSQNPPVTLKAYEPILVLINARLAAASIYDRVMMANQTPNVSDYGKNQRALAYDDLSRIVAGDIQLKGQVKKGRRFARQELLDNPRLTTKPFYRPNQRAAGQ